MNHEPSLCRSGPNMGCQHGNRPNTQTSITDGLMASSTTFISGAPNRASSTTSSSSAPGRDPAEFYALHRAIIKADWDEAQEIFRNDKDALTAVLEAGEFRPIHVAIGNTKNIEFIEKLLNKLDSESLLTMVTSKRSQTVLDRAAIVGNTKAAELLVKKNPHLLFRPDSEKYLPVHRAVFNSHKTTFLYLVDACKENIKHATQDCNPFEGRMGAVLLTNAITSGFLDIAYQLLMDYPHLAIAKDGDAAPLKSIGRKWDAYYSGTRYNFYERFIYSNVPIEINDADDKHENQDIENQDTSSPKSLTKHKRSRFYSVIQRIQLKIWKVSLLYVSHVKQLQESKIKHHTSLMILKRICEEVLTLKKDNDVFGHYGGSYNDAVKNDTVEVVRQIVHSIPRAIWTTKKIGENSYNLPQVAIINRCQNVYGFFIREVTHNVHALKVTKDKDNNNLLHLAGQLAPVHKLNAVSGAALQMQRELQWFKEVERFMRPKDREAKNKKDETPIMTFRREHHDLRKEGEEWMKKTADSYTITAALIITIVFAAAITVPGGTNGDTGKAIYITKPSFVIFAVSDAISLFTSTTSLLLFLSILTARYAEDDFLYKLPKRLILGLAMLFLSVTSMMVAFSATLYLMFGHGKAWIVFPIATLACLPIASFVTLQLPLLFELIYSTYGHGVFRKQIDPRIKQS